MKSNIVLLAAVLGLVCSPAIAATLKLQNVSITTRVTTADDGTTEDFDVDGNQVSFVNDPGTSTFAQVDATSGEIKVRAFDSPIGSDAPVVRGLFEFTFQVEGGGFFAPEGFLSASFDSTFSRAVATGNHFSQTFARHTVVLGSTLLGKNNSFISTETTEFSLLPTRRLGAVTVGSGGNDTASFVASDGSLTTEFRSQAAAVPDGTQIKFLFALDSRANASGSGFADSNSSNTLSISMNLPDGVDLDASANGLNWITSGGSSNVGTVPLPSALPLLLGGLMGIGLFAHRRRKPR